MTIYIQRLGDGQLETVDEFPTRREAQTNLAEYRMSDPGAHYYLSQRACADWDDSTPDECPSCGTTEMHIESGTVYCDCCDWRSSS